jgi:hypothetical protein
LSKWPEAKNIEISRQWNETAKQLEVKLVAEQVPFNKKDLVVRKMQVSIKSPKLSKSKVSLSVFQFLL